MRSRNTICKGNSSTPRSISGNPKWTQPSQLCGPWIPMCSWSLIVMVSRQTTPSNSSNHTTLSWTARTISSFAISTMMRPILRGDPWSMAVSSNLKARSVCLTPAKAAPATVVFFRNRQPQAVCPHVARPGWWVRFVESSVVCKPWKWSNWSLVAVPQ